MQLVSLRRHAIPIIVAAFLAAVLLAGCTAPSTEQKSVVIKVEVSPPIADYEVLDFQDFTGRLDGFRNIDVKARVTGYLESVNFKEGDIVQKGDLLFLIDPKPYQADLDVAIADLNVAHADWENQQQVLARDKKLVGTVAVSQEQYELDKANEAKSKASVGKMEAARDKAQLYLDYTRVVAPITGRVSRRYVDPGNDVIADMTLLTSIVTINPVYAYYDVDERTYLDLQKRKTPRVLMRLATEEKFTHLGNVDFIDNRVNANAGTIRMRGKFDYIQGLDVVLAATGSSIIQSSRALQKLPAILYPGLFCRVRVPVGEPYKAFLIPDEALMTDQGRKNVLVVTIDEATMKTDEKGKKTWKGVVVYRQVDAGQLIGTLRVIKLSKDPQTGQPDPKRGLTGSKNEYVITKGQQRVRLNTATLLFSVTDQPVGELANELDLQQIPRVLEEALSKNHRDLPKDPRPRVLVVTNGQDWQIDQYAVRRDGGTLNVYSDPRWVEAVVNDAPKAPESPLGALFHQGK